MRNKTLVLGVIDTSSSEIESVQEIVRHINKVKLFHPNLVIAPDCGMGLLPPDICRIKLENMVTAVKIVNSQLSKTYKKLFLSTNHYPPIISVNTYSPFS